MLNRNESGNVNVLNEEALLKIVAHADPVPAGFIETVKLDLSRWASVEGWWPTLRAFLRKVLLQPGFQLVFSVRIQRLCRSVPVCGWAIGRALWYFTTVWLGAEISADARVGPGAFFPHPNGIVIGSGAILGKNVTIYQGVTLGRSEFGIPEYPVIGNFATIYAGAKVFGAITVGNGAVVGANAVVLKDVPPSHLAIGIPAQTQPLNTNLP
jgi:serine O-acetyltransferase